MCRVVGLVGAFAMCTVAVGAHAADGQGGSSTVVCIAGCTGGAPQVVQHIPKVVSAGPRPAVVYTEMVRGVWCGPEGHCIGSPGRAPSRTRIDVMRSGVDIWSW